MHAAELLDQAGAAYEKLEHSSTYTAQGLAATEHVPGQYVAKPVLIRADGKFVLCVLPACCRVDLTAAAGMLSAKDVRLASEAEMMEIFTDCEVGAEPPVGKLYNLPTFVDRELAKDEYVVFQDGTHREALKVPMDDYLKIAQPEVADFARHA